MCTRESLRAKKKKKKRRNASGQYYEKEKKNRKQEVHDLEVRRLIILDRQSLKLNEEMNDAS